MDPRTVLSESATALEKNIRQQLSLISSHPHLAEPVKYSFHIPVEMKRETSLGFKLAFDEMLYTNLSTVVELLLHQARQFHDHLRTQKEEVQKRTAVKDYLIKLNEFIHFLSHADTLDGIHDYLMSANNAISQLYQAWSKLKDGFEAYIKSIHVEKSFRLECDEFHDIYLDGFYQHVGLHYRLQSFRSILARQDRPENAIIEYEVREIGEEFVKLSMSKKRAEALSEIAQLDPDESLPMVLYELNSITKQLQRAVKSTDIDEQIAFLKNGIATIFDGEQKQRVQSLAEITSLAFHFDKHKFKQDMNALVAGIENVVMTPDTLVYWDELALLFEGLHLRFYRLHSANASKKIDGVTRLNYAVSSSTIDGAFHKLTGFYRINIGEIYYAAAQNIHRKIKQYQAAHANPSQSTDKSEVGVTVEEHQNPELIKIITIAPRREGLTIAAKNRDLLSESTDHDFDAEMLDDLSIKSDVSEGIRDDLKIIKLADVINSDRYQLREHHLKKLHFLELTIASEFAEYVNSGGGWARLGYERAHAHLVQAKLEKISSTKDVTARLKTLIDFRAQLKSLNSVTILAKVEKILLLSHSQLMDSLQPKKKLIKRASKANMLMFPAVSASSSSTSAEVASKQSSSKSKKSN